MVRNGTSEIELADDLARYSKLRGAEDVACSIV